MRANTDRAGNVRLVTDRGAAPAAPRPKSVKLRWVEPDGSEWVTIVSSDQLAERKRELTADGCAIIGD